MFQRKLFAAVTAAAGLILSGQGATIEKFDSFSAADINYKYSKRDAAVELLKAPESKGLAAKVSWNANKFKFAELTLKKRKSLPAFEEGYFKVKVYAPANSPVNRFNLRLIDASHEVFQWNKSVSLKPGWQEVVFNITPNNLSVQWGGNKDKKLDQPVKLLGFGIDFKKNSGKSFLWVDDISFTSGKGDKVSCIVPAAKFDDGDQIYISAYGGKYNKKQNRRSISLNGKAHSYLLRERKWNLKGFKAPEEICLTADLKSGSGYFQAKLRGAKNKIAETGKINLKPGFNKYDAEVDCSSLSLPVKLEYLGLYSKKRNLDVDLVELDLMYKDYPVNAIKVDIETGNPVHVLKAGEEKKLKLKFSNISDVAVSFSSTIDLVDFFGEKISYTKNFTIPSRSVQYWPSPALPARYGIWWVNYSVTDNKVKDSTAAGQLSFAYMPPAGPTPGLGKGFLFGMCTHTERWGRRDRQLEIMAAGLCGAKIIRTSPSWNSVERSRGKYDWTMFDELVKEYGKQGMELQPILAFTPRWAAPPEKRKSKKWTDWSRSQPDLKAYGRYGHDAAKRYKGKIRFWEVWNEPDLKGFFNGTLNEYLGMMKAAYKGVKKGNPDAIVMTGGFATMNPHQGRNDEADFQEKSVARGKGFYEVHAFHQHGSFNHYRKTVDEKFLPMRKRSGVTVPWYANETAIASMDGAEKMQAETLYKKIIFAWSRGAIAYNWYDLRNDGFDSKEHEHNYGIMTNDFYPKAGYVAYNALALNFTAMKFDRQLELGGNLWAFIFKDASKIIVPAWNEEASASGKHIVIKTDAKQAASLDIMGNLSPLPVTGGLTVLEVAPVPAALYLYGATSVKSQGALLAIQNSQIAIPGRTLKCPVQLQNPFAEAKKIQLSLVMPDGITSSVGVQTVEVAANRKKSVDVTLNISKNIKTRNRNSVKVKLLYAIVGTPWRGAIDIPVNLASLIPAGDLFGKPAFSLKSRDNVFSLCAADPALSHLVWKDANDLSADIWLRSDGKNLLVKIDVTDDVHRQEHRGFTAWKGDNIQMGIQVPGQNSHWEIGLSLLKNGQPDAFVWTAPGQFNKKQVAKAISLEVSRNGNKTLYTAKIPLAELGMNKATLKSGIKFNLLVNDNDAGIREGWIYLAPGIGEAKDPKKYPFLIFE